MGRTRVAVALALGVAIFMVLLGVSVVVATIDPTQSVNAETTSLVSAVVGGVVGALAVYLGQGQSDDPSDPVEPWEPPDEGSDVDRV